MIPADVMPAFMRWTVPTEEERSATDDWVWYWQAMRCAACGRKWDRLVEDHDHETGLTRGYLCHGCNVWEGTANMPLWDLWRAGMNPFTLFGIGRMYIDPSTGTYSISRRPRGPAFEAAMDQVAANMQARMLEALGHPPQGGPKRIVG